MTGKQQTQTRRTATTRGAARSRPAPGTSRPARSATIPGQRRIGRHADDTTWIPTESDLRVMPDRDYMNAAQLAYFRERLMQMHRTVLQEKAETRARLREAALLSDDSDRATLEEQRAVDLRMHERRRNLRHKIELALKRIDEGRYGYCEQTGDPIGIPRLLARPTAEVCIGVKTESEKVEALYRDVRSRAQT